MTGGPFTVPPVVVSHRGNGRGVSDDGVRENTLAAFEAAVESGIEWVEVDVRRTLDDGLCVLHHATTDDGTFVTDLRLSEVRDHGVLELDDLLDALPQRIGIVFDVKTSLEDAERPADATTAALLTPTLRRLAEAGRAQLVTSFDPAALLHVGALAPEVPRGLLTWLSFPLRKAIPAAAHLGVEVVSAHWKSFARNATDPAPIHRDTAYSVEVAHRAGLQVVAWCPDVEQGRILIDAGVDALVMDDVSGGLRLVAERMERVS